MNNSTLIVDGDNLLTIGFYGLKNYHTSFGHVGGLFHFINTLRKTFDDFKLDKIVVFWDGDDASLNRRKIYPLYKTNRISKNDEEEDASYDKQKIRIKQYLEELFVRQAEFPYTESDDCIAYYVSQAVNENKIIYSSDKDLMQLVKYDNTKIYDPSLKKFYSKGDIVVYKFQDILTENIGLVKMICGDTSDNINGIRGLGIKKLVEFFPEIKNEVIDIFTLKSKAEILFQNNKNNKSLANLLTGVTKSGILGDEFFVINDKLINLDNPIVSDNDKLFINEMINSTLDPEGRSYRNTLKMMMDDGIFNFLPKSNDGWTFFFNPFLKLTSKEKNKTIKTPNKTIKFFNENE